jgi:D-alanine-D-alanine ligase-like ATP-grasp enzyme
MTEANPVAKKPPMRILLLWNQHESADLQTNEEHAGEEPEAETTEDTAASEESAAEGAESDDAEVMGAHIDELVEVLREQGYRVEAFNLEDDPTRILDAVTVARPDVVVNQVDELYSEAAQHAGVAAVLELFGVPFAGADALCLATCQNRVRTHILLAHEHIPVPRFAVVRDADAIPKTDGLRAPLIVTQAFDDVYEDEGIHSPVAGRAALEARCSELLKEFELPLLIEEYIDYRRIHAIVVEHPELAVLPLVEYAEAEDEGEAEGEGGVPWSLAELDGDTATRLGELAQRAFFALGCRDMAQIDLHLDDADNAYVVDVRPMVDLSVGSVLWTAAEHAPGGYDGVLHELIQGAGRRAPANEPAAEPVSGSSNEKTSL